MKTFLPTTKNSVFFILSLLFITSVSGQVAITSATGGTSISADKAANSTSPSGGTYTTLGNIILTEGSDKGAFASSGTLILTAPSGWKFNPDTGSVTFSGNNITATSINVTSSIITITITVSGTDKTDSITISGIQVKADDGSNLLNGNILRTSANPGTASITGIINGSTNFGSLSQAAGAMKNLVVTLAGQTFTDGNTLAGSGNSGTVTAQTVGTSFTISKLTATDQFYNVATIYSGAKTISYSGPGSSTGGAPTYTTSVSFTLGVSTTTLTTTLRKAETIYITAQESGSYGLASSSLTVNPKTLTVTGATVTSKTYDGTTAAVITGGSLTGVLSGDAVSLNSITTGSFDTANVGISKTVTPSIPYVLSGSDAANYTITQPALTGTITARSLTITGVTASNKTYDGLTTTTLNGTPAYVGLQNGESFSVTGTPSASFATATVGTGKAVTVTGYTAPSTNYTVTQPAGLTADITALGLTITNAIAANKTYDGTNTATITGTLSGILGTDVVTLIGTGTFNDQNVGTGKAVTANCSLGGTNAANYYIATQPTGLSADITPKALTISGITVLNKIYDGLISATLSGTPVYVGLQNGETFTVTGMPSASFASASAGNSKAVTVTGYIEPSSNYTVTQPAGLTADITKASLIITGISANNKTYDRLTTAILSGAPAYVGLQNGETFTVTGTPSASFATAIVGIGKAVTVTGYTAPSTNYTVTQPAGLTADITALGLTITNAIAANKTYDGTNTATITGTLSGILGTDVVTLIGTGTFNDQNVGTGKAVTANCSLGGADAPNYIIATQPTGLTADITAKALTISGVTANNKTYDGLTTATLSGTPAYVGLQNGETFAVTGTPSATFATASVGTGKAVTVTGYTAPSTNYTVTQPTGLTANITAASLTISGVSANNKAYNGLTAATLSGTPAYVGLQNGETFTVTGTLSASFATAAVGTGKAVTVTGYTAPSANYTVIPTGLTADITAASLTISGVSANNKTYDGLTTATLNGTPAYVGLQNGESFSVTGTPSANFATASVGTGKAVTITGYTAPNANYTVTQPTGLTANITAKALTISGMTANNKTYDGLTTATLSGIPAYVGLQNGETFAVTGTTSATFATASVGTGKAVTVTGYAAPSSNYTVTQPSVTANITAATLTISGISANNKTYNGLTTATLSGTAAYVGLQNGETFSVSGTPSATFASAAVGTGKTVTVIGYTAPNTNYTVTQPAGLTADITTKTLIITVTANNKTYDGLTTATLSAAAYVGLQNGESFAVTGTPTANFATSAVGTGIAVTVTGYTAPNANYTVTQPTGLTANIIAKTLTISGMTANNKTYDGLTTATLSGTPAYIGLQNGELFTVTGTPSANFATANVGTGKAVTVSGYTAPSSNYTVTQPTGLTANITAAPLTISGVSANNKIYNGLTTATLSGTAVYVGLQNGQTFSVTGTPTANFATASVGTGKTVTVTGYTAPNSNYTVVQPTGLTGDITAKALTITANPQTKCFGTTLNLGTTAFTYGTTANSETITSVTLTSIGNFDAAGGAAGVHAGDIAPSNPTGGNGFLASNYNITFVNGTLTVDLTTTPGAVSGGTTVCVGSNSTVLTLGGNTGNILRWESSADGTIWASITNTANTYTATNLTVTTQFRAVVQNGVCSSGNSTAATITVNPVATANAATDQEVCSNGNIVLAGSIGGSATSATWSAPSGSFSNPSSLTSTYTPGIASGTVVLTLTTNDPSGPCPAVTSTMTVTVKPVPDATGVSVCQGSAFGSGSLTSSGVCPAAAGQTWGPNYAGTGTNQDNAGSTAWSNPAGIASSGVATITLPNKDDTSDYLIGSNYGFTIPTNATISGITVVISRSSINSNGYDDVISLVKAGTITGSNLATTIPWDNGSPVPVSYGGVSNLWGTTWTASDINTSNFGVAISVKNGSGSAKDFQVDYIQITVTYIDNGTIKWYTQASGGTSIGSGSPFSPVGVAGSGLPDTSTPGTTTYYAECSTNPGCRSATTFVVNPNLPASVIIAASPTNIICSGTSVTFTATPINGGSIPSYQWKLNGASVGTNSATYTSSSLANNDKITVVMTSNASPCLTGSPATSNQITMTVNPILSASVAITSSATGAICSGTSVTFTASPTNGGSAPSYQWYNGTIAVGTNSNSYTSNSLANNDKITVVMTSNASPCLTGSPATSNQVIMMVNPNLPASVVIAASSSSTICQGTSVTFTATPTNGGSNPSYQWYKGATAVGTNSSTYTSSSLLTNDIISVVMTSNASSCLTGSPATSNQVTMIVTAPAMPLAGSPIQPTCTVNTGSISLSNLPGGSWILKSGSTTIATGTGSPYTVTGLTSGTYNFSVTDASGCTSPSTNNILINAAPVAPAAPTIGSITQPTASILTGSFAITNYDSSYSYSSNPATGIIFSGNTAIADPGTYTITATLGTCTSAPSNNIVIINNNKTWNGSASTDWFTASNWTPVGVPTSSNYVFIPNTTNSCLVSSSTSIANANTLTIYSGGKLDVDSISILTVTDKVTVNTGGTFNLQSGGSLIQTNNTANDGIINAYRDTSKIILNDYTYWSSPTSGTQTLYNFSPNSNPKYFLRYSNGWMYLNASSTTFSAGTGYAIIAPKGTSSTTAASKSYLFTGTPNNGNVNVHVDFSSSVFSSTLIGNPYPCAIDADKFIDANIYDPATNPNGTLSGTLYFWTHNNGYNNGTYSSNDYAVYTKIGSTITSLASVGHANTSAPTQFIASGQGFIAETVKSGDVIFTNAMRSSGPTIVATSSGETPAVNGNFYKNANNANSTSVLEKNRIWLNFSNNAGLNFSQILLGYIETATNNYDPGFDGAYNSSSKTGMYSLIGNNNYSIQARALPFSQNDIIPLGFTTDIKGNATISIDHVDGLFTNGQDIFIEDKLLNIVQNLKIASYTFSTEAGTFNDRFVVKYSDHYLGLDDMEEISNNVIVSTKNHQIKIQSETELIDKIIVYDILGREIYRNIKVNANETQISDLKGQQTQAVIVKVILVNGKSVSKKVINQ